MKRDSLPIPCLYFLADESCGLDRLPDLVLEILRGGAGIIQFRAPQALVNTGKKAREIVLRIKSLVAEHKAFLLINNDVALCQEIGAHGVHLGQTDMPVSNARRLLGNEAIIGLTIHTQEEANRAAYEDLDYVSLGPVFPGSTKPMQNYLEIEGAARLKSAVRAHSNLPIFYISGITHANMSQLRSLQPDGIALCGDLSQAADAMARAGKIREQLISWQSL